MDPQYAKAFFADGTYILPGWTPELSALQKGTDKQQGQIQAVLRLVLERWQKQWEAHLYLYLKLFDTADPTVAVFIQDHAGRN